MKRAAIATTCASLLFGGTALASSHREAPNVSRIPKEDGTDLYMFRSYETGRTGNVTFLANYQPFQDPFGRTAAASVVLGPPSRMVSALDDAGSVAADRGIGVMVAVQANRRLRAAS